MDTLPKRYELRKTFQHDWAWYDAHLRRYRKKRFKTFLEAMLWASVYLVERDA